jgi:hypothetical protein
MTDKKAIFKEVDLPPDPTRGLAGKHEKCAKNNLELLKVGQHVKKFFFPTARCFCEAVWLGKAAALGYVIVGQQITALTRFRKA